MNELMNYCLCCFEFELIKSLYNIWIYRFLQQEFLSQGDEAGPILNKEFLKMLTVSIATSKMII